MTHSLSLKGKTGLVIGASGGIGSALARLMAEYGARLVLHHRGADDRSVIDAILREAGGPNDWDIVHGDLASAYEVCAIVERLRGTSLDFLCIASGTAPFVLWEVMNMDTFRHTFEVNVFGPTQLVLGLQENITNGGAVVVVSSTGAYFGCARQVDYNASKAALNSLVQSWAISLGHRKVRVNGIAPGWVNTPMAQMASRDPSAISRIPLGRVGTPRDIAQLAVFMVSDMNPYMSGNTVVVDGGRLVNTHGDQIESPD